MYKNKNFFLIGVLFFSMAFAQALTIQKNGAGFPVCIEDQGETHFFIWNRSPVGKPKTIYVFKKEDYNNQGLDQLANCRQYRRIKTIPKGISRPIQDFKNKFPDQVTLSLQQVAAGATQYIPHLQEKEFLNTSCEPYIGDCDFYLCQEAKNKCGFSGYNLGYGYKYCDQSRNKLFHKMKTDLGKKWVTQVFQCLQRQSFENSKVLQTCEQTQSAAFDSHPNCYVEAGFCNLKFSEKFKIFKTIKAEIFSSQTVRQGLAVLKLCRLSESEENKLKTELLNEK